MSGVGITSEREEVVTVGCSDCLGDDVRLSEANAALIVRAVNNYDALLAALEEAVEWAQRQSMADRPGVAPDWYPAARAAIAQAEKETP